MAIKLLLIMLFFALVVIAPVHSAYPLPIEKPHHNKTTARGWTGNDGQNYLDVEKEQGDGFLWLYVVFSYLYTGLTLYFLITETRKLIEVRQNYLGTQSSATDRTLRLTGVPRELRSETKIKQFLEELEIGKVEKVYLCRDTLELDDAVDERDRVLRKLESASVKYRKDQPKADTLPHSALSPSEDDDENGRLLEEANGNDLAREKRPQHRIWYGPLRLRYKNVDAINYYGEKLHSLDEQIASLRQADFPAVPMAFVTMDSTAACVCP
jgi:hypothetical protein